MKAAQDDSSEDDASIDVISIADDDDDYEDDDNSFSSSSSSSMIHLQIPAGDTTQDDSVGTTSPPLNTQPAPAVKKRISSTTTATRAAGKKRKVSMSPTDSLAKTTESKLSPDATARNLDGNKEFRLTKVGATSRKLSKTTNAAERKQKAKDREDTKAARKKKVDPTRKPSDATQKLEQELALMNTSRNKNMRREALLADDSDDDDGLITWAHRIPRKVQKGNTEVPFDLNATQTKSLVRALTEPNKSAMEKVKQRVRKNARESKGEDVAATAKAKGTTTMKASEEPEGRDASKNLLAHPPNLQTKGKTTAAKLNNPEDTATGPIKQKDWDSNMQQGAPSTTTLGLSSVSKLTPPKKNSSDGGKQTGTAPPKKRAAKKSTRNFVDETHAGPNNKGLSEHPPNKKPKSKVSDAKPQATVDPTSVTPKTIPKVKPSKSKRNKVELGDKAKDKTHTESTGSALKESTEASASSKKTASTKISGSSDGQPANAPKRPSVDKPAGAAAKPATNVGKGDGKQKVTKASGAGTKAKPKKKKKRFDQQILHHMVTAMKPFTLRSLAQELKTTEQQLHHTLLAMKDKNLVFEKEFISGSKGRSKTLIWANLEAKEVAQTDYTQEKATQAMQEGQLLVKQERDLQQQLETVTATPCNNQLTAQVEAETAIVAQLRQKLDETKKRINSAETQTTAIAKPAGFRGFHPKPKSAAQLACERCPRRMKTRINAMRGEWKSRRDKCKDFVDNIADAMEKKPKDVYKLLDVETDEMAGVVMPARYEV